MKVKTAVRSALLGIVVLAIVLGVSGNLTGWKNVVINYPIVTLFVLVFVILCFIVGWHLSGRFLKPLELKVKEKYGVNENIEMDKRVSIN